MADLFDLPFEDEPADPLAPEEPLAPGERPLVNTAAPPTAMTSEPATPRPRLPATPASDRGPRRAADLPMVSRPKPILGRPSSPHPPTAPAAPAHGGEPAAVLGSSPSRALTVTQLTLRIRGLLEGAFTDVWVEGELSNCRPWNTGHLYFTLKDRSAQIKGVIFRSALRYLRFKPEDGLKVVARGRLSVYDPKGEYQLVCEHLEPQGLGALQLAFEQLKGRLEEEGLFDAARKRPLPALPRMIGIVTSLDGAAIRDMLKVLGRRHSTAHVIIRAARVQGEGASVEIARALKALGRQPGVEVIIVGRGGGSIEDLWAFNEEIVARAVALCPVPVISAVGHETDVTIADFVADLRAPTPSAAAEMVVAAKDEFSARIDRLHGRLRAAVGSRVQSWSRRIHVLTSRPAFAGVPGRLALRARHAADASHALAHAGRSAIQRRERHLALLRQRLAACDLRHRLGRVRTRLVAADARAASALSRRMHRASVRLRDCAGRLETLSPLGVLARGYAVCWNADRTAIVRTADEAPAGSRVTVTLHEGELECEVRASKTSGTDAPIARSPAAAPESV